MTSTIEYGRYASGRAAGYLQAAPTTGLSIADLTAAAAAARATIAAAATAVSAAIAGLGVSSTPQNLAAAVQAHVAALAAASVDPATRVRLLVALARYAPTSPGVLTAASVALSTLYRLAAVSQLVLAGADYAPASYDDAVATRGTVTAAIDAELQVAGDTEADGVFAALRTLRQNVVLDLNNRGASLPRLHSLQSAMPQPDVVVAMRAYGDPDRTDELVTEADPPHPLFMPVDFLALVS